ncbi:MAG: hypothetical protein ACI8WB_006132, partial [Phenylobacterium sp.]
MSVYLQKYAQMTRQKVSQMQNTPYNKNSEKVQNSQEPRFIMKKRDLKEWIIVFTIVPTIVSGLTLAAYFTINRFSELTDS